jgi:hypothetical protein
MLIYMLRTQWPHHKWSAARSKDCLWIGRRRSFSLGIRPSDATGYIIIYYLDLPTEGINGVMPRGPRSRGFPPTTPGDERDQFGSEKARTKRDVPRSVRQQHPPNVGIAGIGGEPRFPIFTDQPPHLKGE